MRLTHGILIIAPFLWASALTAQNPGESDELRALIRQLGSPVWAERSAASEKLRKLGPSAYEALYRTSLTSDDPQIKHQAGLVLEAGLWKGLPLAQLEDFRGYFEESLGEKEGSLSRLVANTDIIGSNQVRRYMMNAFLYDPDVTGRRAVLLAMEHGGLLPALAPLEELAASRDDAPTRLELALCLSRTGFPEKAMGLFETLPSERFENSAEVAFERARSLLALGQKEKAAALALSASKNEDIGQVTSLGDVVDLLLKCGLVDEAEALWSEIAITEGGIDTPRSVSAKRDLAATARLAASGRYETALKFLAHSASDDSPPGWRFAARTHEAAHLLEALGQECRRRGTGNPEVMRLARILACRGHGEKVAAILTAAIDGNAPDPATVIEAANALVQAGKGDEAAALLTGDVGKIALGANPSRYALAAANLLHLVGDLESAFSLVEGARNVLPMDADLAEEAGLLLEAMGKKRQALRTYVETLQLFTGVSSHERIVARIEALAEQTGQTDALPSMIEERCRLLGRRWRREMDEASPNRTIVWDRYRSPVLSFLARLEAKSGHVTKARKLAMLAYAITPKLFELEEITMVDRVVVEASASDEYAIRFQKIFLHPLFGLRNETESEQDLAVLPDAFWSLPDPHPGALDRPPGLSGLDFRDRLGEMLRSDVPVNVDLPSEVVKRLSPSNVEKLFEPLCRLCEKGRRETRRLALVRIADIPGEKTTACLTRILKNAVGDFSWQRTAASLLQRRLEKENETLKEIARNDDGRNGALAASALLAAARDEWATILQRIARNHDHPDDVRAFAVTALARHVDTRDKPFLKALTQDASPDVRRSAAVCLARLNDPAGEKTAAREIASARLDDIEACVRMGSVVSGPSVSGAILDALRDPYLPWEILLFLACRGGIQGTSDLATALYLFPCYDDSLDALWPLFEAIAEHGDPALCRGALTLLFDSASPIETYVLPEFQARAALLAEGAGDHDLAKRLSCRAWSRLNPRGKNFEKRLLIRMGKPEGVSGPSLTQIARSMGTTLFAGVETAEAMARALAEEGKRDEAVKIIREALLGEPEPGLPLLAGLLEKWKN